MLSGFSLVWLFVTHWTIVHQAPLPMDFFQARLLVSVATSSSRGSSQPRDWTPISCISGRLFSWAIREAHGYSYGEHQSPLGSLDGPSYSPHYRYHCFLFDKSRDRVPSNEFTFSYFLRGQAISSHSPSLCLSLPLLPHQDKHNEYLLK